MLMVFIIIRLFLSLLVIISRKESMIDVNRDFPFDFIQPPYLCLQSETSRALQILYNHNIFVATITFHAGMQSISYEWGDFYNQRRHAFAPDHYAMKEVADAMDRFCGILLYYDSLMIRRFLYSWSNQSNCLSSSWRNGRMGICWKLV